MEACDLEFGLLAMEIGRLANSFRLDDIQNLLGQYMEDEQ
jgi:hypothetical protein